MEEPSAQNSDPDQRREERCGRNPKRPSVPMKKCSCSPEPQPNRCKVCRLCGKEFPQKKKARIVKGRVNPTEQAEHMRRRASILHEKCNWDTIMISVNPTASNKHLSLNVWSTDGIAQKYFGTPQCVTEMGELVALSFLKFESSERNIPVDIKRWRREMRRKREKFTVERSEEPVRDDHIVEAGSSEITESQDTFVADPQNGSSSELNVTLPGNLASYGMAAEEESDQAESINSEESPMDPDAEIQNIFDVLRN
eukprot:Seg2246.7 transcript_id=Seg2246.7/GoldUCD/mRNA.D3Y31 product="hypothetical protein" protein_id=Seg2246.7/GoldUCD/D3Y31